jgi:hypothetical protein
MRKFVCGSLLSLLLVGLVCADNILVPGDRTPFEARMSDIVRIPARGIAGTQVTARVTGPAKAKVNSVIPIKMGMPLIGPGNHEVEVKPTGKGKVTVEVTIQSPTSEAVVEKYEFEVK